MVNYAYNAWGNHAVLRVNGADLTEAMHSCNDEKRNMRNKRKQRGGPHMRGILIFFLVEKIMSGGQDEC